MTEQLEKVEARIEEIEAIREEQNKPERRDYRRNVLYAQVNGFDYVVKFLGQIKNQEYHRRLKQRKRLQKGIRNWKSN